MGGNGARGIKHNKEWRCACLALRVLYRWSSSQVDALLESTVCICLHNGVWCRSALGHQKQQNSWWCVSTRHQSQGRVEVLFSCTMGCGDAAHSGMHAWCGVLDVHTRTRARCRGSSEIACRRQKTHQASASARRLPSATAPCLASTDQSTSTGSVRCVSHSGDCRAGMRTRMCCTSYSGCRVAHVHVCDIENNVYRLVA